MFWVFWLFALISDQQEEQITYEGISTHFHAFGFSDLFDVTDDDNGFPAAPQKGYNWIESNVPIIPHSLIQCYFQL